MIYILNCGPLDTFKYSSNVSKVIPYHKYLSASAHFCIVVNLILSLASDFYLKYSYCASQTLLIHKNNVLLRQKRHSNASSYKDNY